MSKTTKGKPENTEVPSDYEKNKEGELGKGCAFRMMFT